MSNENRTLLDAAVAPGTPVSRRPGARRLLEDCWTSIRNAVEPRITDVLLEALGPIARSENEDVAKPAKIALSRDRAFVQAYSDALQTEFRSAVADFVAHRLADAKAPERKSLSLIDYGDMEFSTLIESSGARIRNAVDDEYTSVKLRVANLVREPDLRDGDHPFRPAMFLRAAHQALEKVGVPKEDLLRLTHCFDAPLIGPVRAAYAAVDHHLASQGVSAELARTTITRNTAMGRNTVLGRNSMLGVPTNTGLGMPMTGGGLHFAGGLSAEQVLQGLYQRMQLLPQAGYAAPGMMGDPRQAAPGHYVPAPTLGGTSALRAMQALQGMPTMPGMPTMQGVPSVPGGGFGLPPLPTAAAAGGGAAVLIEPGLLNALNEIQKLGAIAMSAVQMGRPAPDAAINVAELRGKLTETASKQVDKLTIEIVGLLFDRINQDKHVPEEIKHLIQRLQFPLIKVALTDPELFVSPQHPARLLLDRIASTSIGWTTAGEDNQRYLAEVQKVVHAVLAATEDGLGAFEKSLAAFEQYLAEEKTRDDDPVARAKRALAEAESREVMAINATIQVRSAFDGVQLESYLREFLLETWVRVLVAVTATRAAQIAAQGAPCPVWIDFAVDPIEEIRRDPEAAEMIQQALARADVVSTSTGEREDVLLGQLGFVGRLNRHTVSAKRPAAEIAGEAQGAANGARGIAGMGNAGLTCVIPDDAACDGPAFGPLLSWAARPFFATDRNTLGPNAPLNSLHALFV